SKFNVNPKELAAMGGSAGGNLALLLGTAGTGSLDTGARVRVAVSWSGPTDLTTLLGSNDPQVVGDVNAFADCPSAECQTNLRLASPVTRLDSTDASMLIANSADEIIPFPQAQAMADTCK